MNIWPRSSQLAEPLWTDPGIKSEVYVCKLISTKKEWKEKKHKRRMNGRTFPPNPCKRGKSHHHGNTHLCTKWTQLHLRTKFMKIFDSGQCRLHQLMGVAFLARCCSWLQNCNTGQRRSVWFLHFIEQWNTLLCENMILKVFFLTWVYFMMNGHPTVCGKNV